jgi:hypothetical protein
VSGHGEKFTRKSEQFMTALLREPTIEAAAKAAGVAPSTGRRWLQDEAFIAQYRGLRRDAMQHALALVEQAASGSVKCLMEVQTKGESESARVSAARCILETALRSVELNDIQERLERLEQAAKKGWGWKDEQPDHAPPRAARIVNGHV